jgi:hypothetical protein
MTAPLAVVGKKAGENVTRILLNSGSYVVCHMDGRMTCIHARCIAQRVASDCEHVAFVRETDTADAEDLLLPLGEYPSKREK